MTCASYLSVFSTYLKVVQVSSCCKNHPRLNLKHAEKQKKQKVETLTVTRIDWEHRRRVFLYALADVYNLPAYALVVFWGEANTQENTSPCLRIKKSTRAVVLRLATIARFFKVPDLRRPHDFVSKLLSPHLKVLGKWRLPAAVAKRRMLCFHIIRSSTEEQRKENKNVRCPNNSRGSWGWQIKEGNKAQ